MVFAATAVAAAGAFTACRDTIGKVFPIKSQNLKRRKTRKEVERNYGVQLTGRSTPNGYRVDAFSFNSLIGFATSKATRMVTAIATIAC
jgi:hypothetical protein